MKTWKIEMMVVAAILGVVNYLTHGLHLSIELVGSLAVLLTFGHAQIADRLAEQEGLRDKPTVDCHRMMWWYFGAKEMCWLFYFLFTHTYSALVGVFVFLAYPVWRGMYRFWQETHRI